MKSLTLLLVFIIFTGRTHAQNAGTFTEELLHLRFSLDHRAFDALLPKYDKDQDKKKLIEIEKAIANNSISKLNNILENVELDPEEDYIAKTQMAWINLQNTLYLEGIRNLDNILLPEENRSDLQKAEINHIRGLIYTSWGDYQQALEHLTEGKTQFEKAACEPGLLVTTYSIVKVFLQSYKWDSFEKQLDLAWQENKLTLEKYPGILANFNTMLASKAYLNEKVDSALLYVKSNIPIYRQLADSSNVMKTYLNLAFAQAPNDTDAALQFFEASNYKPNSLDSKRQDFRILISMMSLLYDKKSNASVLKILGLKNVEEYFQTVEAMMESSTDQDLKLHYYRQKVMYYKNEKNHKAIVNALEQESDYFYELHNKDTTNLQLLQYQLDLKKTENERLILQKKSVENENQILNLTVEKRRQENLIYGGVFGGTLLFLLGLWYYSNRLKKERHARDISALQAVKAERKLDEAEQALVELKQLISEKSKIIETFSNKLELTDEERHRHDAKLREMKILTNEDWMKFQKLFNKAYPKMNSQLIQHELNLSEGELRMLMLHKLSLHKNQISEVLGISPESVRKAVYRLRKKIDPIELDFLVAQF